MLSMLVYNLQYGTKERVLQLTKEYDKNIIRNSQIWKHLLLITCYYYWYEKTTGYYYWYEKNLDYSKLSFAKPNYYDYKYESISHEKIEYIEYQTLIMGKKSLFGRLKIVLTPCGYCAALVTLHSKFWEFSAAPVKAKTGDDTGCDEGVHSLDTTEELPFE